jgi:outer membrane protein assembly factor BamB
MLWESRVSACCYNDGTSLGISPTGTILYVGGQGGSGCDYATLAYRAATGGLVWSVLHSGRGVGCDTINDLVVSPDGMTVFVTGGAVAWQNRNFYYDTIAYDARTGVQLWEATYDPSPGNDIASSIEVTPDGSRVFVTGIAAGDATDGDAVTLSYDAATGTQQWLSRYNSPANLIDLATAMAVSPDGAKVFVTGSSENPRHADDTLTIAYDAPTGDQLWASRYDSPSRGDDIAVAMDVSPDGSSVFIVGNASDAVHGQSYLTVAYDADVGTQVWVSRYKSSQVGADVAKDVGVSPDGARVFVTGGAYDNQDAWMETLAYDAGSGTQEWAQPFSPEGYGTSGYALAVSATGDVFVVGFTYWEAGDYATTSYDGDTGQLRWSALYDGPSGGEDNPEDIALTPHGGLVFVTGQATGPGGDVMATLAYIA